MYFSIALILASLPFLTAAVPVAESPAPRGIAVPITKRGSPSDGVADTSALLTGVTRSIAYALHGFTDYSGNSPIIDRKIQTGFAIYEINTGLPHPLSQSANLSRRAGSGGDPLTDFSAKLWFGNINVGTPAVTYTGMTFYMLAEVTLSTIQWISILEVAISSYPRQVVDRAAQGTRYMTRVQARPRRIFRRRSP